MLRNWMDGWMDADETNWDWDSWDLARLGLAKDWGIF